MKWTNSTTNPAGKIQCKRVNEVLQDLSTEHNTYIEKTGVIGGQEHSSTYMSIFGIGNRKDVAEAQQRIGERFAWTVSRENVNEIIAAVAAELPALRANRPVKDERRTPEQEAERQAERLKVDAERTAAAAQHAQESNRIEAELRAKYPWALPADGKLSPQARAAANLRAELNQVFPGIRFSVRSSSFSGGNAIDVGWTLGPTTEQVKEVTDKYQRGSFDGMTDSYDSDHSAYGEAVSAVLGRAKYVSENRSEGEGTEPLLAQLCALEGVEMQSSPWQIQLPKLHENAASALLQIILARGYPAGAVLTGIEINPEDGGAAVPASFYRTTFKVEAVEMAPVIKAGDGVTVTENEAKNGVEIRFPSKPEPSVLDQLKANGWRWSRFSSCWYAKRSEATLAFAHSLVQSPG